MLSKFNRDGDTDGLTKVSRNPWRQVLGKDAEVAEGLEVQLQRLGLDTTIGWTVGDPGVVDIRPIGYRTDSQEFRRLELDDVKWSVDIERVDLLGRAGGAAENWLGHTLSMGRDP